MENAGKPKYITATSLTARQINRSVILNIIYAQQPISRADTARVTGLQRSTVSLIVDELIDEGWIVEGEYNRIPRGRRPIFLQLNSEHAGFIAIHLTKQSLRFAVADLNGNLQWMGEENLAGFSMENFGNALRRLSEKAGHNHNLQIKGVGIAIDESSNEKENIRTAVADLFKVPVAIDITTVACGKRFLIFNKDAKLANNHLVVVHADNNRIDLGIIVAGKPLRGAHGRAGSELSDDPADSSGGGGGVQTATATRTSKELANRLEFAVAAYDPGVILLNGPLIAEDGKLLPELEKRLSALGAGDTALRILKPETAGQETLYLEGAVAVILDYFLDECPG